MKNIYYKAIGALTAALLFTGCITKSDYTVCAPEELREYDYALITEMTMDTAKDLRLINELSAVLNEAGIEIVEAGDEILGTEESGKILLTEYTVEEGSLETILSIAYTDFVTKEEIAFCRGTWGLKNKEKNLALSEDNAIKQTRYMFGLANEADEFNEYSWY
ncbi:MAG: hypothetical protein PQJ60_06905 [Spirochaetales bacterium]|nr:hypothetical protein [Spirochaetales bacterium]